MAKDIKKLKEENEELKRKLEVAKEALQFYSRNNNYKFEFEGWDIFFREGRDYDKIGTKARVTLKKIKSELL